MAFSRRPVNKGLVYGVATNDADYQTRKTKTINGKTTQVWICPFYRAWMSVLARCYSKPYIASYKYDYSSTVCEEWLVFSNFRSWMEKQEWEGRQLDKDILVSGNRKYSESTCVFVTQELNKFFNLRRNSCSSGLIGATKNNRNEKYYACITVAGRTKSLGGFHDEISAHFAWVYAKAVDIGKFICNDGSRLDNRLIEIQRNLFSSFENKIIFEKF